MTLRVRAAPEDVAGLEARARELATSAEASETGRWALVKFTLGGTAYALDLSLIERVVTRLGTTGPLAGAPADIRGLAFVDSVPLVAVDLLQRTTGVARDLQALALAPALVLRTDDRISAVCVEGPLELMEAPRLTAPVAGTTQLSSEALEGRLFDGTLVLSSQWLQDWVSSLAEGA